MNKEIKAVNREAFWAHIKSFGKILSTRTHTMHKCCYWLFEGKPVAKATWKGPGVSDMLFEIYS